MGFCPWLCTLQGTVGKAYSLPPPTLARGFQKFTAVVVARQRAIHYPFTMEPLIQGLLPKIKLKLNWTLP